MMGYYCIAQVRHLALVRDSRLMMSVAPWSEWNTSRMVSMACGFPPGAADRNSLDC